MSDGKLKYIIELKDGFTSVLGKVQRGVGGLMSNIGRMAGRVAGVLTSLPSMIAGSLIGGFGGKSIFDAMGVEESESKFRAVFKSLSAEVRAWSIEFADAVNAYRDFIRNYPASRRVADAQYAMAEALEQLGRWVEAMDAYQTFREKFSNDPKARMAEEQIQWIRAYRK